MHATTGVEQLNINYKWKKKHFTSMWKYSIFTDIWYFTRFTHVLK